MDADDKEGVKITDRRRFTAEGESRQEGEAPPTPDASEQSGKSPFPPIDFPTFILSLATSAQIHLGAIANPQTGKPEQDLTAAKETIDLLGMLREKTKGNLTPDEERLFEHLLYDVRMMYVEQNKKP
jgi:hypothetical protein